MGSAHGDPGTYDAGHPGQFLERLSVAFGVTSGDGHALVYANPVLRALLAPGCAGPTLIGQGISASIAPAYATGLQAMLDRAYRTGMSSRNIRIPCDDPAAAPMCCTVWPDQKADGSVEYLMLELREATAAEFTVGLQREVAERLLLRTLQDQDTASATDLSRRSDRFLAAETRRLGESLEEGATLRVIETLALPHAGDWCFVDMIDEGDRMHRLAMVHPDPARQAILAELDGRWIPQPGDVFGLPAALRAVDVSVLGTDIDTALRTSAGSDTVLACALAGLGVGSLVTVPLVIRERIIGAVTFVSARPGSGITRDDIELARDLAGRSAVALDRARTYGEMVTLKTQAESAIRARTEFLGMMSHELRTPLNAIGGYVSVLELEIHGPVTEEQRADLVRIRTNQRYLMGLVTDLLNFSKVGSGGVSFTIEDLCLREVVTESVALVEPLITAKQLSLECCDCDDALVALGDPERVTQILVNLLSNAIKFTPPGGQLVIDCHRAGTNVVIRVCDTGIGIPAAKIDAIFDPFVQVRGTFAGPEAGVGLGLAISRGLAREMNGALTVESTLGEGARFSLTLPRAMPAPPGATIPV